MKELNYIIDNEVFIEQLEQKLLQKLEKESNSIFYLNQLIEVYRKKGDIELAKKYCVNILKISPKNTKAIRLFKVLNNQRLELLENSSEVDAAPFKVIENFLPEGKLKDIELLISKNSSLFNSSTIHYTNNDVVDETTRKSKVLSKKRIKPFSNFFQENLKKVIPKISQQLNVKLNENIEPELSLTMHLNGDFFNVHKDVLSNGMGSRRKLTYVYYYHSKIKKFKGGNLLLFDTDSSGNKYELNYTKIVPKRNSIIFFPSHCYHKVTPIKLASDNFLEGRFTINGWFHK